MNCTINKLTRVYTIRIMNRLILNGIVPIDVIDLTEYSKYLLELEIRKTRTRKKVG